MGWGVLRKLKTNTFAWFKRSEGEKVGEMIKKKARRRVNYMYLFVMGEK